MTQIFVNLDSVQLRKGSRGDPEYCPLARGIRSALGAKTVRVHGEILEINGRRYTLPEPLQTFVYWYDRGVYPPFFSFSLTFQILTFERFYRMKKHAR